MGWKAPTNLREKFERTNRHHRHTRHQGGGNHKENISVVPISEHQAFNKLFRDGHMPPPQIAEKFSRVWLRPDWEVVARRKGQQCVTPCGKESSWKSPEDRSSSAVAEKCNCAETTSSASQPSTTLTAEKLLCALELALTALNASLGGKRHDFNNPMSQV